MCFRVYTYNKNIHMNMNLLRIKRQSGIWRIFTFLVITAFIVNILLPVKSQAQSLPIILGENMRLPSVGTMVDLSPVFRESLIRGITIHPDNPLQFDFIVDRGEERLEGQRLREEGLRMAKYFLAALTVPEDELWVNLSPYEKDRIVPDALGVTEMGRDLLAQDYLLKQLTASLIYPEDELGKKFWQKVYQLAYEKFGTTDIPVDTFNKVWIVPEKAVVYEQGSNAFVASSHLTVMMEEDYVALNANAFRAQSRAADGDDERRGMALQENDERRGGVTPPLQSGIQNPNVGASLADAQSGITSQIIREIVIPELEKEVNEGEHFARLRQVFNAMILAMWYKRTLKESLLGQIYVDQNKTAGVDVEDKQIKQKIYEQYLEAFKKGVFDFIKEDYDPATQDLVVRKYFSGGVVKPKDFAIVSDLAQLPLNNEVPKVEEAGDLAVITVNGMEIGPLAQMDQAMIDNIKSPDSVLEDINFRKPFYIKSLENLVARLQWLTDQDKLDAMIGRYGGVGQDVPSGKGFYGLSTVLFLHPTNDMEEIIDGIIKPKIMRTAAFQRGAIKFYPNQAIHHTLDNIKKHQNNPIPQEGKVAYVQTIQSRLNKSRQDRLVMYVEGLGVDEERRGILRAYFSDGFKVLESNVRSNGKNYPRIDLNFFVLVDKLNLAEAEELARVLLELSEIPIGSRMVEGLDITAHNNDMLFSNDQTISVALNQSFSNSAMVESIRNNVLTALKQNERLFLPQAITEREDALKPRDTKLILLDWDFTISWFERVLKQMIASLIATGTFDGEYDDQALQKAVDYVASDKVAWPINRKNMEEILELIPAENKVHLNIDMLYDRIVQQTLEAPMTDPYTDERVTPGSVLLLEVLKSLQAELGFQMKIVTNNYKRAVVDQLRIMGKSGLLDERDIISVPDQKKARQDDGLTKKNIFTELKGYLKDDQVISTDDSVGGIGIAQQVGMVSLSTANGLHSRDQLKESDYLVDNLSAVETIVMLIFGLYHRDGGRDNAMLNINETPGRFLESLRSDAERLVQFVSFVSNEGIQIGISSGRDELVSLGILVQADGGEGYYRFSDRIRLTTAGDFKKAGVSTRLKEGSSFVRDIEDIKELIKRINTILEKDQDQKARLITRVIENFGIGQFYRYPEQEEALRQRLEEARVKRGAGEVQYIREESYINRFLGNIAPDHPDVPPGWQPQSNFSLITPIPLNGEANQLVIGSRLQQSEGYDQVTQDLMKLINEENDHEIREAFVFLPGERTHLTITMGGKGEEGDLEKFRKRKENAYSAKGKIQGLWMPFNGRIYAKAYFDIDEGTGKNEGRLLRESLGIDDFGTYAIALPFQLKDDLSPEATNKVFGFLLKHQNTFFSNLEVNETFFVFHEEDTLTKRVDLIEVLPLKGREERRQDSAMLDSEVALSENRSVLDDLLKLDEAEMDAAFLSAEGQLLDHLKSGLTQMRDRQRKYVQLNPPVHQRTAIDKGRPPAVYIHGSNSFVALEALRESNAQLIPKRLQSQLGIVATTGARMIHENFANDDYVSTIDGNLEFSTMKDAQDYANNAVSTYRIDLGKANSYLEKSDDEMGAYDSTYRKMKAFKEWFEGLTKAQQMEYNFFSRIPVIILGDSSGRQNPTIKGNSIRDEVLWQRLNIRVLATEQRYEKLLRDVVDTLGFSDIIVMNYDDLSVYENGHAQEIFGLDQVQERINRQKGIRYIRGKALLNPVIPEGASISLKYRDILTNTIHALRGVFVEYDELGFFQIQVDGESRFFGTKDKFGGRDDIIEIVYDTKGSQNGADGAMLNIKAAEVVPGVKEFVGKYNSQEFRIIDVSQTDISVGYRIAQLEKEGIPVVLVGNIKKEDEVSGSIRQVMANVVRTKEQAVVKVDAVINEENILAPVNQFLDQVHIPDSNAILAERRNKSNLLEAHQGKSKRIYFGHRKRSDEENQRLYETVGRLSTDYDFIFPHAKSQEPFKSRPELIHANVGAMIAEVSRLDAAGLGLELYWAQEGGVPIILLVEEERRGNEEILRRLMNYDEKLRVVVYRDLLEGISPLKEAIDSVTQVDYAMVNDVVQQDTLGGIDLNPAYLDLQIKRDPNGVPLPVSKQSIADIHIEGILPVIINIAPLTVPMLLSMTGQAGDVFPDSNNPPSDLYPQTAFLREERFVKP